MMINWLMYFPKNKGLKRECKQSWVEIESPREAVCRAKAARKFTSNSDRDALYFTDVFTEIQFPQLFASVLRFRLKFSKFPPTHEGFFFYLNIAVIFRVWTKPSRKYHFETNFCGFVSIIRIGNVFNPDFFLA